jgi:glucan phosphoethanolaminetransferase (alkaline phosphatase superfamily)
MIQRIQTVFLVLVIAGMIAYLFLPYWIKPDPISGAEMICTPLYLKQTTPGQNEISKIYLPYILCGAGALIAIAVACVEVSQYKNRMTQIKLGMVNSILMSLVLFFSAWLAMKTQKNFMAGNPGIFKAGLFAPVISMIFNTLANRYIKKDEDLVRSADRIR